MISFGERSAAGDGDEAIVADLGQDQICPLRLTVEAQ